MVACIDLDEPRLGLGALKLLIHVGLVATHDQGVGEVHGRGTPPHKMGLLPGCLARVEDESPSARARHVPCPGGGFESWVDLRVP